MALFNKSSFTKQSLDHKLKLVGEKLKKNRNKLIIPGQRSEDAFLTHTSGRILQSVENGYFSQQYFDPVEMMFSQAQRSQRGSMEMFSGLGYSAVSNAPARSAEDITIITAIVSLLPYLSIERAMTSPEQSISYENLIAMHDNGKVNAGDVVLGSFTPSNLNVGLSYKTLEVTPTANDSGDYTAAFGAPIIKGQVRVVYTSTDGETVIKGRDFHKDGIIHWDGASSDLPSVAINYDTGEITLTGTIEDDTITVKATVDSGADGTGSQILRVRPDFPTAVLKAEPRNIIIESSISAEAYKLVA